MRDRDDAVRFRARETRRPREPVLRDSRRSRTRCRRALPRSRWRSAQPRYKLPLVAQAAQADQADQADQAELISRIPYDKAETAAIRLWRDRAHLREHERDEAQARARIAHPLHLGRETVQTLRSNPTLRALLRTLALDHR